MFLAYDASRKLNDYLTRVVKAENIPRKNLEVQLKSYPAYKHILVVPIYSRDFSAGAFFPITPSALAQKAALAIDSKPVHPYQLIALEAYAA